MLHIYISQEENVWSYDQYTYFTLENSLYGAFKLAKMLLLINILVLDMVLNLMHMEVFHCPVVMGLVKT